MTPRLSIIAASIRRLIAAIGGTATATASDYYWDNVVLAMKMDTGVDPEWSNTVLAMHMDDTSFVDLKSHNVTSVGTPSLSATHSKFGGKSALFNGTTDYLTIPTSTDFGFGTGDFTVECWVKTATSGTVLDLRSSSGELGLFAISGGFISLWNGSIHLQGFTNVTTDAWVHLAWVRSAGVVSMFVNGVLDGVSATSATFGTTRPVRIGADIASANFFSGYIDDLRVSKVARYAVEFSPSAVPFLDGTAVPFLEQKGKAVTVVGNTSVNTTTKQYGTGSGYFDGTGDYLTLDGSADFAFGTGDFTIECWMYRVSATDDSTIIRSGPASGTTAGAWELNIQANNMIMFSWDVYTGGSWLLSGAISVGWNHIAVSKVGTTLRIFINGVISATNSPFSANLSHTPTSVYVGGLSAGQYLNGYIDDLRITKGVARYISNFTPPTESLATNKKTYLDPYWNNVVLGLHMDGADDGTVFTDVKGSTPSVTGGVVTSLTKQKFGAASAKFTSSGDYITIPNLAIGTSDFTVEFWMNPTSVSDCSILSQIAGLMMYCYSGNLHIGMAEGFAGDFSTTAVASVWTNVVLCRSGVTYRAFVNGQLIGTQTGSASVFENGYPLKLGHNVAIGGIYEGYIDDLRITKGVGRYTADFQPVQLPFPEKAYDPVPYVSDAYLGNVVLGMHMDGADNGTVFTDYTSKTVTPSGNAVTKTGVKKFGTASAYFDGNNDYISTPGAADFTLGTDDFTIEAWVKMSAQAADKLVVDYYATGFSGWQMFVESTGEVTFYESNPNLSVLTSNIRVNDNTWHHIAFARDGGTLRVFCDGNLDGSVANTKNHSAVLTSLSIGAQVNTRNTAYDFIGYIDDVRITKGIARYTSNFTPPTIAFSEV